jgi:hypothetical protein
MRVTVVSRARRVLATGFALFAAAGAGLAAGCGGDGVAPSLAPRLSEIEAQVFSRSCVFSACHGPTGPEQGLSLAPPVFARIVDQPASEAPDRLRVAPGDPDGSYLLEKLERRQPLVGQQMPPGQPLDPPVLAAIRQWIVAGAADD